jgi:hypothetical protein
MIPTRRLHLGDLEVAVLEHLWAYQTCSCQSRTWCDWHASQGVKAIMTETVEFLKLAALAVSLFGILGSGVCAIAYPLLRNRLLAL